MKFKNFFITLFLAVITTAISLMFFKAHFLNPGLELVSLPQGHGSVILPSLLALPVAYLYSRNLIFTLLSWILSIPVGSFLFIMMIFPFPPIYLIILFLFILIWPSLRYSIKGKPPQTPQVHLHLESQDYPHEDHDNQTVITLECEKEGESIEPEDLRVYFEGYLGGRDEGELISGEVTNLGTTPSIQWGKTWGPPSEGSDFVNVANVPGGISPGENWRMVLEVMDSDFAFDVTHFFLIHSPTDSDIFEATEEDIPPIEVGA